MTRKTYCGNLLWQSGLTLLVQRRKYAAPYRAAGKPVWAVALSFKSRGRKFAGGRAVPVK